MSNVDFGNYKRIVQAFWDPEPKNDDSSESPIWCLGENYVAKRTSCEGVLEPANGKITSKERNGVGHNGPEIITSSQQAEPEPDKNGDVRVEKVGGTWPTPFLDDCESRMWFTYRSSFSPIKKSPEASMTLSVRLRSLGEHAGFTSDTGWGCMIRSGQSLLANALTTLRLGREWRRGQKQNEERRIVALFADDPASPFSIHRFVEHGASACGKHPGEWFGPSATARCIQALSDDYAETGLKVYVNGDGADVYEDRLFDLAKTNDNSFTPTLILLQIRLGIDRTNPLYWNALKDTLRLPQSIGIAGGRPGSSHYFYATQGDHFFYLDPHFTRPALPYHSDPTKYTEEEVASCHTRRLRRLHLRDMDPSMLLAFLIKSDDDWRSWRQAMANVTGKPIVHISDKEPSLHGLGTERSSAVDDVETLDDEDATAEDHNGGSAES